MARVAKPTTVETLTVAQKIWERIKDLEVNMFALPDQKVHKYCEPQFTDPNKLTLTYTVAAFLPALELVVQNSYNLDRVDFGRKSYIVLTEK